LSEEIQGQRWQRARVRARVILIIPFIKRWGEMSEGNSEKLGMVLHYLLYSRFANFAYPPLSSMEVET